MKSCNFKLEESDIAAYFYRGTVGRLITTNGLDQSVGGEISQAVIVAIVK
jgi:hypothetical protein